jgi:signal transduction histidine kinase/DNA-binding response OmpR family regulator/ligand-binding sensor domain-containing protein
MISIEHMRLKMLVLISLTYIATRGYSVSTYVPQAADRIKEKYCWTAFPELYGKDVLCFTEDSTGNLWFGIGSGIMRYDGLKWKLFSQKQGLPDSYIQNMRTSPDGKIYGVYETNGVFVLKDTLWTSVQTLKPDSSVVFHDVFPCGHDSLWIATNQGAVLNQHGVSVLFRSDAFYPLNAEGNWTHDKNSHPACDIYDVYQDRKGSLWFIDIAGLNGQIVTIPDWKHNIQMLSTWKRYSALEKGSLLGGRPKIYQATDGTYWIYTYSEETSLYYFTDPDSKWSSISLTEYGGDNVVLSILETRDHTLWLGGNGYLYAYKNHKMKIYRPVDLNIQISPIRMLQTRDGALWLLLVNTAVYRIDYTGINWEILENLHFQCDSPDGGSYFISADGRVVFRKPDHSAWLSYGVQDGLMDMPSVVLCTHNGIVWAAGSHKGDAAVSRLTAARWHTDTFPDLSWSISYQSVLEAQDGRLWFGSMGDPAGNFRGGCVIYQPDNSTYRWQHMISRTESFNRISAMTQTNDGAIWAGGSHLLIFDRDDWKLEQERKELQKSWIDHIMGASDGSLWVAKGGVGVFNRTNGIWRKYTIEDNLPSNMVTNLLEIPGGILAATEMGISRFNGQSWTSALPADIRVPRESGTLKLDSKGRIWVNLAPRSWFFRAVRLESKTTFSDFRTIGYRSDSQAPETVITIYQKQLARPANQYISWQGYDRWGATANEELTFSYRLDSGPWSAFFPRTSVQLLNMDKGFHTFQVRAMDRDGNMDPDPALIKFKVIPPVWSQPWFVVLVSLFGFTIIGLLLILSLKNQKLSEAKNEIERIASFKERFFLNVSHEVRTPLTMILAPISRILNQETAVSNPLRNQLDLMHHHGHYLLRLVNQMLDFRKMESGKYHLQVAAGDIVQFVSEIVALFALFAEQHHIRYTFKFDVQNWTAWFDGEKLQVILMNLIGNALKYTPDGGSITVFAARRSMSTDFGKNRVHIGRLLKKISGTAKGSQWFRLEISDTGIGIPADRLAHIFDRFYHVEHPGKLFYDSIGVGLDFTKELVELHHGDIHVESKMDKGTTFTVMIPMDRDSYRSHEILETTGGTPKAGLSPEKMEEIREERRKLQAGRKTDSDGQVQAEMTGGRPRLLIVEDHPDMRNLIGEFLKGMFEILQAEEGAEGIEMALQHVPDLVISDVMMPEMDGIELTRRLKTNVITSHIPVILLTVKSEAEHRIQGYETGADAYLAKPFEYLELLAVVRNLIESRRALKERFSREIMVKPQDVTINSIDENFLRKCIQAVEDNITEPEFHVDQFCRAIGMSRTQAYRKVKSISGFSMNEFITHVKLKRAAQLLVESEMNISEIAYSLGFCDHAHMSRHFRKAFGYPPKEYRKRNRSSFIPPQKI